MSKMSIVWLVVVTALLVVSAPVSAAASAAIIDPIGDAAWFLNTQAGPQSARIPDYQDIIGASISKRGNTFTFSMDMAGAVPDAPPMLGDGVKLEVWVWAITSDPAFSACGDPLPSSFCPNVQFEVRFNWDGTAFSAFLLDRRPLATGEPSVHSSVPFSINGAEIQVFVDAAAINNPSTLMWGTFTVDWMSPHLGTWGNAFLDFAPDAFESATWPS
jgi:hypothetical protein